MDAYIIEGARTAIGKATRGGFRFTRPDDLAAHIIKEITGRIEGFDPMGVDDLIVGNAVPEAEQGMQMGRMIALLSLPLEVPGVTVNRYCGSGLEAIAIAAQRIHAGMADCIIAGGTESMSLVPVMGFKTALNYEIATNTPTYYTSMGLTAEQVAEQFKISREDQDAFSLGSHEKALAAIDSGRFAEEIVPYTVKETFVNEKGKRTTKEFVIDTDEGPRKGTNMGALSKLKPAFAAGGSVTAGNASQTSDGAAFVILMSEKMMKKYNVSPKGRMVSYSIAGVEPRIMGIGPVKAVPKALEKAGKSLDEIDLIELNEAFAAQSIAVVRELGIDESKLNVNGGAIALGHPLGCTGARLSLSILHELEKQNKKYGLVTACVGGGQGVAGVFEKL